MDAERKQLFAALGRVPSGLFVLTIQHEEQETGMLTSWVQQCAFEPPCLSFALKCDRPILGWLSREARFTLNILDNSQTDMVAHFGRGFELHEPAFVGLDIERHEGGGPILLEALAYLEGIVRSRCSAGDHEVFLAEVVGGRVLGEGQPMVHIRKSGAHY
jgi:flavin reductase (DIM6/NTAB) family NADH-FMN oxidoreductase RutF